MSIELRGNQEENPRLVGDVVNLILKLGACGSVAEEVIRDISNLDITKETSDKIIEILRKYDVTFLHA